MCSAESNYARDDSSYIIFAEAHHDVFHYRVTT